MIGDEVRVLVSFDESESHLSDGFPLLFALGVAVTSEHPDYLGFAVSASKPTSIDAGILRIEDRFVAIMPVASPSG